MSRKNLEEFEMFWRQEVENDDPPSEELNQPTDEYARKDGIAKNELMGKILLVYFHTKWGEPMPELYFDNPEIKFQLALGKK
jgi:hypothetical protein